MAQAASVTFTFNGTVTGVSTETYGTGITTTQGTGVALDVFGGGNLTGQAFSMTVTWDPSQLSGSDYVNVSEGNGANSGWVNDPIVNSTFSYGGLSTTRRRPPRTIFLEA